MKGQTENTDHGAETEGGQRAGIGNLTSTEAKAETENKTGNLRKKVSLCGWYKISLQNWAVVSYLEGETLFSLYRLVLLTTHKYYLLLTLFISSGGFHMMIK